MQAAKLDILIEIQAKLDGLLKVNQGLRDAKQEASTLGGLLRQGLSAAKREGRTRSAR